MKVRWPWGQRIIERGGQDRLQVHQEFLDVFTKESGWGLTSEFIERFPELLQGMSVDRCRAVSNYSGTAILDINHRSMISTLE